MRQVGQVHRGAITTLCYSNNGEYLLSGGMDHIVKMWDAEVGTQVNVNLPSTYYF